jgi:hypothetical protein
MRMRLHRTGSLIELRGAKSTLQPLPSDTAVPSSKRLPSDEEACIVLGLAQGVRECITFEEYVRARCSFPSEAEAEAVGLQSTDRHTIDSAGLASPLRTLARPRPLVNQFRKFGSGSELRGPSTSMLSPAHSHGTPTVDELTESSFED